MEKSNIYLFSEVTLSAAIEDYFNSLPVDEKDSFDPSLIKHFLNNACDGKLSFEISTQGSRGQMDERD